MTALDLIRDLGEPGATIAAGAGPVARANLSFKWTDNKTLKGDYRIMQGEKVLLHTVITGQKQNRPPITRNLTNSSLRS